MSDFETDTYLSTEGGYVPMERPTTTDLNHIPVAYGRNAQTDARKMSEVGNGNIMDDRDLDDVGYQLDIDVTSIANEKRRGGWDPLATPNGGMPARASTSGTRGADDIGKL